MQIFNESRLKDLRVVLSDSTSEPVAIENILYGTIIFNSIIIDEHKNAYKGLRQKSF